MDQSTVVPINRWSLRQVSLCRFQFSVIIHSYSKRDLLLRISKCVVFTESSCIDHACNSYYIAFIVMLWTAVVLVVAVPFL